METENKLIAEQNIVIDIFMTGRELGPTGKFIGEKRGAPKQYENWYNITDVADLKYHTSWDWLMPVVEKIEDNGAVTVIKNGCKIETLDNEFTTCGETTLISVYAAVVQFINWYNEQQLTQITNP